MKNRRLPGFEVTRRYTETLHRPHVCMLRYGQPTALRDSVTKALTIQQNPVRGELIDGANSVDPLTLPTQSNPSRRALVEEALERILASRAIGRSAHHRAFLKHVVGATLDAEYGRLKESTIALEVFKRDASSFDSTTDSIVRVEAARVRQKLDRYYADEGGGTTLRIEMVAGNYRPRFVDHAAALMPSSLSRGLSAAGRGMLPADLPATVLATYERAWYVMRMRTLDGYRRALALFKDAIRLAPEFAAAHRAIAWARINIAGHVGVPLEAGEQGAAMVASIERARAIEPDNPELDTLLGAYLCRFCFDLDGGQAHYEAALKRNAQAWGARSSFAWLLIFRGRFAEAQLLFDAEFAYDPFAFFMRHNLGMLAYFQRDFARAERIFSEALEIEPGHLHVRISRSSVLIALGDADAAVAEISACWTENPELGGVALERVRALAAAQRHDEARAALAAFDHDFASQYVSPVYRSAAHIALGDIDEALTWLERAAADGDYWLLNVLVDPAFDALRGEPRFAQAMSGAGLLASFGTVNSRD